jgi:hypothetical protein
MQSAPPLLDALRNLLHQFDAARMRFARELCARTA